MNFIKFLIFTKMKISQFLLRKFKIGGEKYLLGIVNWQREKKQFRKLKLGGLEPTRNEKLTMLSNLVRKISKKKISKKKILNFLIQHRRMVMDSVILELKILIFQKWKISWPKSNLNSRRKKTKPKNDQV